MKSRLMFGLGALLALSGVASATVRIGVKDGKRYIYNDGQDAIPREALRHSGAWLASRLAIPSLYDGMIDDAARAASVDPKLVKCVVLIESAFNPGAISRKGARGLMQLMPETADQYGVRNAFDPVQNIGAGARHLAYLLGLYNGSVEKSLAAYNAGEGAVARYGGVPPFSETRLYVTRGMTAYYGGPTLGGGFGRPQNETWAKSLPGKPVRLTRDKRNRPLITTELSARAALRS